MKEVQTNFIAAINELSSLIHEGNVKRGFWPKDQAEKDKKNTGELLMLATSELAEALESDRKGKHVSPEIMQEAVNEFQTVDPVSYAQYHQANIKDTFEDELADTLIRICDMAAGRGIDLGHHVMMKLAYNETRPYKHGKAY